MQDPPEVRHEWQLKKYGRKIARQVNAGDGAEPAPDFEKLRKLPLEEKKQLAMRLLGVPVRTTNALESLQILFIGQLLQISHRKILAIPNCGPRTILSLVEVLEELELLELWDVFPEDLASLIK